MDDWEAEDFQPLPAKVELKSNWDDEDVDENDIKDSWEEEDVTAPPPVVKPAPEKAPKKAGAKAVEKKVKTVEASKESSREEPLDPIAEKLRMQRLVEEADYQSTAELFGVKTVEKSADMLIPKSESDFVEYAELISQKLVPFEKSFHYIGLLKTVMRLSLVNMKAADVKDVASSITAIANEKLKAEKEAAGKKKTGKKKQLHVDKPDDDLVSGPYGAMDDDDFM
ncbi:PREDICTED: eukaryotic translation initiation factor 3 subunit J-A-like [Camelina sativa]|uniref:Eukaryotic translation initiation factor 3 subunit J n=1 Tax=Camelina sativa TaxID=90675 RepID=A0ABM0V463_CAMSA|nr:PREDICTED: eukaryotic translation initiation factor 3 subunit J-A-like [Camelina sativa]